MPWQAWIRRGRGAREKEAEGRLPASAPPPTAAPGRSGEEAAVAGGRLDLDLDGERERGERGNEKRDRRVGHDPWATFDMVG
jgi:hypothetical protein